MRYVLFFLSLWMFGDLILHVDGDLDLRKGIEVEP